MGERVPCNHPTVTTHRVRLETVGRTGRPRIAMPGDVAVSDGDVVRLELDGETHYTRVTSSLDGQPGIEEAHANRKLARTRTGGNALPGWVEDNGLVTDEPLLVDVVRAGHQYGLRQPGTRVIYEAIDPPDGSLSRIADDLE